MTKEQENTPKPSLTSVLLLTTAFFIYASTGIYTKLASTCDTLSMAYLEYLALATFTMGCYAVLWQMVLKQTPLTQAYIFKSTTIMFSLLLAWAIFHETITARNIIGCILIMIGIAFNARQQAS